MDNKIRQYKSDVKANIAAQFEDKLTKGEVPSITKQEFDKKYDVGYEVFSTKDIHSFVTESLEKSVSKDEINSQLATLDEIIVKGEDDTQWKVFVREIERGQEAQTE